MLVFRSFAIGLSAACFALLVMRPAVVVRVTPPLPASDLQLAAPSFLDRPVIADIPTIVDVAPGVSPAQIATTIRLSAGEQITTVDDISVANDLGAGILLASHALHSHQFIDLGVSGPQGDRRVLVLLH